MNIHNAEIVSINSAVDLFILLHYRVSCAAKTDNELPRYGKKWGYVPNIPATEAVLAKQSASETSNTDLDENKVYIFRR